MGSPCELLVETVSETDARHLADIAATEAWRIEDKFSRYLSGNIVDQINRGESYIQDVNETAAKKLVDAGRLNATNDYSIVKELDVVFVATPDHTHAPAAVMAMAVFISCAERLAALTA